MRVKCFLKYLLGLVFCFNLGLGLSPRAASAAPPTYDELFPYYAESCAASIFQDKAHKFPNDFNYWGHSFLYLKGACRDLDSAMPKIKICDEGMDLNDPNTGVLISTIRALKNAVWIAIQGSDFGIHGNLRPGEKVDKIATFQAIQTALNSKTFDNLEFHKPWLKQSEKAHLRPKHYMANLSLGTDFALDFARTSFCKTFPLSRTQLEVMINYLNDLNEPYIEHKKVYDWRLFENNCEHTARNALAAARLEKPKPVVRNIIPIGILKVIPPGGAVVRFAKETLKHKRNLSVIKAFKNSRVKESFERFGRPPIVPGTMLHVHSARVENNELYTSVPHLFVTPLIPMYGLLRKVTTDPRLIDLKTNFETFLEDYRQLREHHPSLEDIYKKHPRLRRKGFSDFYRIYTEWLNREILETIQILDRF